MALRIRNFVAASLAVWVLLVLLRFTTAARAQDPLLAPGVTYSAPFKQDERLVYEVNWKPLFLLPAFKAGDLAFRTYETVYHDRPVFKVTAEARSSGRLASVAGLDVHDYFESIFDHANFRSYRLIKKIREGKRQRDFQLLFDYPRDRLLLTEQDVGVKPPKEVKNRTINSISEPLADVVSVFYVGRLRSFEVGQEFYINLIDEGEARRIHFNIVRKEKVETPIGDFKAVRINTNGRIFNSGGNLRVWYSTDPLRVPVKFEADVAFGKVYGTLVAMDTGTTSRGRVKSK
jgi:hypothetical protein